MNAIHDRAKSIFLTAAVIASPDEQRAFVEAQCSGDAALRSEVDDLLRHQHSLGSFLETPAVAAGETVLHESPIAEQPGAVIGPYKLLEQIGEGGMGVVFMAEQSHPVLRRVALKIIRPGMDTRQVIARFEAERQALALMDHPNIAKVLDAGTTGEERGQESGVRSQEAASTVTPDSRLLTPAFGRPYFVMELVRGVPITDYCDRERLSVRQRLELMTQVCHAVQHAHQKGIIHRDLKPSNVLVAEYDGRAVPKVIDFGVAKATAQRLTERTMFTHYGQLIGTFEYMSPEQARFNQLDVDTRSDIYSLGVLLYELLAGSTPLQKDRLRSAAFDEILRLINEEEPPTPSTRLSSSQSLPSIAANRNLDPKKLTGTLSGELDWVVMKCLEKDRGQRYDTVIRMAEDIEHFLRDEPVQACPPSAWRRARRFARRHKTALAIVSVLALAGAALGAAGVFAHRNRLIEERRLAENKAHDEELLAEQRQNLLDKVLLLAMNGDFAAAEKAIDEAELLKASTGQLRMLRGMVAYERGDMDAAVAELQRAAKLIRVGEPGAVAARALLSLAYGKAMHGKNCYLVYRELESIPPVSAEDYLFKGVVESTFLIGDDRGLRDLDEAARRRPGSSVIRALRAQARANNAMRTGQEVDAKLAIEDAQISRTMLPESQLVLQQSVFAQLVAAGIYERLGRADDRERALADAKRDVDELRRFAPAPLAANACFDYFDYVGDQPAAFEMSQRGADIRLVAMLYRRGEFDKALQAVDRHLLLDPGFSMAPIERGFILAELPRGSARARAAFKEAKEHAQSVWALTPPMILQYLGQEDEAIQAFRDLRDNPPELPEWGRAWYVKYLDYNCDLISSDELLEAAGASLLNQCEARFAMGMRSLAARNREGAREQFRACVDTHVFPTWEYNWARAFFDRMENDPVWPKRTPP